MAFIASRHLYAHIYRVLILMIYGEGQSLIFFYTPHATNDMLHSFIVQSIMTSYDLKEKELRLRDLEVQSSAVNWKAIREVKMKMKQIEIIRW